MPDPTPIPTPPTNGAGVPPWTWLINQGVSVAIAAYLLVTINAAIGDVNHTINQMTLAISHQTDVVADKCH